MSPSNTTLHLFSLILQRKRNRRQFTREIWTFSFSRHIYSPFSSKAELNATLDEPPASWGRLNLSFSSRSCSNCPRSCCSSSGLVCCSYGNVVTSSRPTSQSLFFPAKYTKKERKKKRNYPLRNSFNTKWNDVNSQPTSYGPLYNPNFSTHHNSK